MPGILRSRQTPGMPLATLCGILLTNRSTTLLLMPTPTHLAPLPTGYLTARPSARSRSLVWGKQCSTKLSSEPWNFRWKYALESEQQYTGYAEVSTALTTVNLTLSNFKKGTNAVLFWRRLALQICN
jgi:hypothetical protein